MKALTLWRPWPELILRAGKDVENRSWATTYRGPLAIHAGKAFDASVAASRVPLDLHPRWEYPVLGADSPQGLVGVVDLIGVHYAGDDHCQHAPMPMCSRWAQPACWHWQLANPRLLARPIPCRGRQGLWYPPGEHLPALEAA